MAQISSPSNAFAGPLSPVAHWAAKYIGLPFVEVGFDRSGVSCWGLVCLVYAEELGVILPRHDTLSAAQLAAAAREIHRNSIAGDPWRQVEERVDFDVILMSIDDAKGREFPAHVGLAVGRDRILHVERGCGAVCIPARHVTVRERILGAWRHHYHEASRAG